MLLRNGVAVFLLLKAFDVQRHRAAAEPDVEIERAGFDRGAGAGHEHCCAEQRRRAPAPGSSRHDASHVPPRPGFAPAQWTVMLIVVVTCMTELLPKFCSTEVRPALLSIE